jgi:hypothetical protein
MYLPPFSIEPTEVVGGCIALYRDVWENPQETVDLIEEITSDPNSNVKFEKAGTIGALTGGDRSNYHLGVTESGRYNEEFRKLNNRYFDLVYGATSSYSQTFARDSMFYFVEGFNLLKYQTGQEYKAHYDGPTSSHRFISPILYINDDYTGGELEFVFQNLKIKPSAGMLALFPSNYAYSHIAHPVKTGTKYAIVTWLHDQPPSGQ